MKAELTKVIQGKQSLNELLNKLLENETDASKKAQIMDKIWKELNEINKDKLGVA